MSSGGYQIFMVIPSALSLMEKSPPITALDPLLPVLWCRTDTRPTTLMCVRGRSSRGLGIGLLSLRRRLASPAQPCLASLIIFSISVHKVHMSIGFCGWIPAVSDLTMFRALYMPYISDMRPIPYSPLHMSAESFMVTPLSWIFTRALISIQPSLPKRLSVELKKRSCSTFGMPFGIFERIMRHLGVALCTLNTPTHLSRISTLSPLIAPQDMLTYTTIDSFRLVTILSKFCSLVSHFPTSAFASCSSMFGWTEVKDDISVHVPLGHIRPNCPGTQFSAKNTATYLFGISSCTTLYGSDNIWLDLISITAVLFVCLFKSFFSLLIHYSTSSGILKAIFPLLLCSIVRQNPCGIRMEVCLSGFFHRCPEGTDLAAWLLARSSSRAPLSTFSTWLWGSSFLVTSWKSWPRKQYHKK